MQRSMTHNVRDTNLCQVKRKESCDKTPDFPQLKRTEVFSYVNGPDQRHRSNEHAQRRSGNGAKASQGEAQRMMYGRTHRGRREQWGEKMCNGSHFNPKDLPNGRFGGTGVKLNRYWLAMGSARLPCWLPNPPRPRPPLKSPPRPRPRPLNSPRPPRPRYPSPRPRPRPRPRTLFCR